VRPSGWRNCWRSRDQAVRGRLGHPRGIRPGDAGGADRRRARPSADGDLARRRLRSKIPELTGALAGRFSAHHAFLARLHLDLIDQHTAAISKLTERIDAAMEPFRTFRNLICSIPGISTLTADVIIAETGADMTWFPTAGHLAS
jgi:transposase